MILTVGLTPAWQRVMRFSAVQLGEINRTAEVVCCAAGKAVNAARALGLLRAPHHALSFAGGPTGEALQRDLAARLVVHTLVPTTEATRTCTTLLDNATGSVTELVEEAGPLSSHELEQFCAAYRALAPRASIIVLSGSLPPDCSTELYRELLTHAGSTPTVVDAHGPALQVLLGVTGSGKTLHHGPTWSPASLAADAGPDRPQQDPGRAALRRVQVSSSRATRSSTSSATTTTTSPRPTSPRPTPTSRRTRPSTRRSTAAPLGHPALLERRDVLIVASVSCIYGIGSRRATGSMAVFVARASPRP
jgi:hypothetical protein